jgi:2-polyprenyl-6-methoxyphenol hydroxylase-like FAD-dependent oxidoreductase
MNESVLVVGAGVAGLALARALAQHGVECTIAERRQAPDAGLGMGLNLPGNATRALRRLGLLDQLLAVGVPVRRREYRNGHDRLLFAVDDAGFWRDVAPLMCLRHGQLIQALRPPDGAVVRYGVAALSVRPTDDYVNVHLDGSARAERFGLVVGADGVHSATRQAVTPFSPRPSRMTRSSWRFLADNPGVTCWTAWAGTHSTLLLIPVEERRVYGYAASTHGGSVGTDPEWLGRAFTGFPEPVTHTIAGVLSGPGELLRAPVEEVHLRRWHRGRVLLIGDAAHATGPVWAQGAAMALEDALVLADLLGRHRDWTGVGAAYEQARRARVDHVRVATDSMSRLTRLPAWLRDLTAPALGPRAYRKAYQPLLDDPLPLEPFPPSDTART